MLNGLYVLTDNRVYPHEQWPNQVERAILGGASLIQLREKKMPDEKLLLIALSIQEICKSYNIPLIINDRISLARKVKADGVHIGKSDTPLNEVRTYLGNNYIIGVSCYSNLISAMKLEALGADYAAFGSIFPSNTKKTAPRCALSTLKQATKLLDIPVCAIGGIDTKNVSHIIKNTVPLIAVSDSVFNANDPKSAANKIYQQVIIR